MRIALLTAMIAGLGLASTATAGFLIEIDTDGADDGVLTFSPNFAFGADTTTATQSSLGSGRADGGDSIYGGDGVIFPDTYLYFYTPAVDGNNLSLPAGTVLNGDGDVFSGVPTGGSGDYRIYITFPFSDNVNGGTTHYELSEPAGSVFYCQRRPDRRRPGAGGEWILLGTVNLFDGTDYTLMQTADSNTFVSMRAAAVLFDRVPVPEPSSLALLGLGGLTLLWRRRQRTGRP